MNAAEMLLAGGDARIAVACEGERATRAELRERVARLAGAWRALGLAAGDVVAVRLADGIGWVEAWLAVIWAGGVAVGVSPRISAGDWAALVDEARFGFVLVDDAFAAGPARRGKRLLDPAALRAAAGAAEPPQPRRADDPVLWVQSSGTSGRAKAVVHAQRVALDIARISGERLGLTADDRLYATSRLFFTYPLVNALLAGLRLQCTLLIDPAWPTPAGVAAFVRREQPSVLFSVPSLYRGLLREGLAAGLAAPGGLRLAVSAGEALPARLRHAWADETGVALWNGWGTAETLVLAMIAGPGDEALSPSPGVSVRALDESAAVQGLPTRLLVRCATLALGYHRRPQAQAESFRDGWFCPADLFVRDGDRWRFAGREDSLVKLSGRWVDLMALEDQLCRGVRGLVEAALACAPDADGLPLIVLCFRADDDAGVRAQLESRIAALPPHQRPARLRAVPALPRTDTGKLLRRALADMAVQEQEAGQAAHSQPAQAATAAHGEAA